MHRLSRRAALVAAALALLAAPARAQNAATTGTTVVVVVRHAEKVIEANPDPALTAAGEARARALAEALADAHVTAVLATPFKRTQATAAPLAMHLGVTPEIVPLTGGTPAHAAAVAAAIRERHVGQTVLVVEHSNTVPAVIRALGGPAMPDLCDGQYASLFVLVLAPNAPPRLVRSSYGVPDAPEASQCAASGMR